MYSPEEKRRVSGGHELAFKMWSTKGARFCADERCKKTSKLSNLTIAFLSFEVIALSIYSLSGELDNFIDSKTITVSTLILSILFLVLSIFENAKEYNLQAKNYHACGIEIGKLYTTLKLELSKNKDEDFNDAILLKGLEIKYEAILEKYPNHEQVDYLRFKINRSDDFKINWFQSKMTLLKIYGRTKLIYHSLILAGPAFLIIYWQYKSNH